MKKAFIIFAAIALFAVAGNAQTKKDGTPDMRFKANKDVYGTGYPTPNYSTPRYSTPSDPTPANSQLKQERNYDNGGQLKIQNGYLKGNGTYVEPHLKTTPDNNTRNNKGSWPVK